MGFHLVNIVVIAGIVLALFGPKALQSMARSAGKGVSQAKDLKDQVLSELKVEEFSNVTNLIPQVPLNPRQAVEMLLKQDEEKKPAPVVEREPEKKAATSSPESNIEDN